MEKILIVYASRTGSTAQTAEFIGRQLVQKGLQTEVLPVAEVDDLTPYRAVIVGSAVQAQQWLPEAMQFVRQHQTELRQKPFAMFSLCMTLAMKNGENYRQSVLAWLDPVRRLVPRVSEGLFPGVLEVSKVPSFSERLKFRISVLTGVWTEGDHRDWDEINAWVDELYPQL